MITNMGCKSSTLAYPTHDVKLARSGLAKYDQVYEQAEGVIAEVMGAYTRLVMAVDNFAVLTGVTAGADHSLCYGLLAVVISAIAISHGDWNDVGLSFSNKLPGIYMEVEDRGLLEVMEAWGTLCEVLQSSLAVVSKHKLTLCEILKGARLAADYMAKDAFSDETPISVFSGQESVALENDRAVQIANSVFQNLALSISEIVQETTHTIEGICAFKDPAALRKIARKAEDANRTAPNQVLAVVAADLEVLVQGYKQEQGI